MNIIALMYRLLGYKTVNELSDEIKKGETVSRKAFKKAGKLSNALMPSGLFYPKGGEVFEAVQDVQISYLTHFMAPFTGGGKTKLLKGERIIVSKPNRKKPLTYYCYPIKDEEIENRVIPVLERNDPTYNGFSLSIDTQSLNIDFKQIALKPVKYINGDATDPKDSTTKIIVHICNDVGEWGTGFETAISKKWEQPESEYRNWFKNKEAEQSRELQFERIKSRDKYSNEKKFQLGNVQFVKVAEDIWIANMIAQRDIKPGKDREPPIRYFFVSEGLERIRKFAERHKASIHMPRIGCGLAGGEWTKIEELINDSLIAHEIETNVYDIE